MIDAYRSVPPTAAPVHAGALRPASGAPVGPASPIVAVAPVNSGADLSPLAAAVKTLASSPPVDVARVASLRSALTGGSYNVDPQAIATKMLILDRGSRG